MSSANIDAYFERIGFAGSIAPELGTLEQLQALHPAAIPFENLDSLVGVPVRLDQRNLEQKLLFEKRGGYCFEQNLLFKGMLDELGFETRGLAAKVLWGYPEGEERPLSHMVLLIDIGGVKYLADVGFGALTPTAPLRLRAETEQATPHGVFRLSGGDPEWRLESKLGEEWKPLYSFEVIDKSLDDYIALNDAVASGSDFRDNLLAARSEKGRRIGLRNLTLNIRPVDAPAETRTLSSVAELKDVLTGTFGLQLPAAERLDPALQRIVEAG